MGKNSEIEPIPQHDLDIDEKLRDHIAGWKFQAAGLTFIFIFVISAALGLFGNGVLSKQTVIARGGFVSFDRFTRHDSRMPLKIGVASVNASESQITFSNSYLEKFRIETIVPEPSAVIVKEGEIQYTFNGKGNLTVVFYMVPQDFGSVDGILGVNGEKVKVDHFIFP